MKTKKCILDYAESKAEIIRDIPELLKSRIREIGVSQSAKLLGVKQPDVSRWLHRRGNWSAEKLSRSYEILKSKKND